MARGRHGRHRNRAWKILAVGVTVLAVMSAGTAYAAYRYDASAADRILPGVTIAGVDVSEMTRAEAIREVEAAAQGTLQADLSVQAGDHTWIVTPASLGMTADVQGAVDRAFGFADDMSFVSRVYHRVAAKPLGESLELTYAYDDAEVLRFVEQARDEVAVPAVDARFALVEDQLVMRRPKTGRDMQARLGATRIRSALETGAAQVTLPMREVEPEVSVGALGDTIVIDLSENSLRLSDGFKAERQYAGADLPPVIDPGPNNPLGTRALYLNSPGIRIHGTSNSASIGTYASHGCIRMLISDSEELYPLVPVGTRVIIMP
jgi:hypothetical protein